MDMMKQFLIACHISIGSVFNVILWRFCAYSWVRDGHKTYMVGFWKTSGCGLKFLLSFPDTNLAGDVMTLQSKIQIVPRSPLKYPLVSQMLKCCSLCQIYPAVSLLEMLKRCPGLWSPACRYTTPPSFPPPAVKVRTTTFKWKWYDMFFFFFFRNGILVCLL